MYNLTSKLQKTFYNVAMNWYFKVIRNYAVFGGRARRKEYWFFILFSAIASFILMMLDVILWDWQILHTIYALTLFIPSTAVAIRRLHDTNHSGWWYLLIFVPIIGWLVMLIFMVINGDPGKNRFGPDPKKSPPPGKYGV